MLAETEINQGKDFTPAEIVRAFTETNSMIFNRKDIDFIKACKTNSELQRHWKNVKQLAKAKSIDEAKIELGLYNHLRQRIKNQYIGLVFYAEINN